MARLLIFDKGLITILKYSVMKKMILVGILALSAVFFTSEKNQSVQIGSSNVTGWFNSNTQNGNVLADDAPTPIPPILWPDPPKAPKG